MFTVYQLPVPEQQAIWVLVSEVCERLITGLKPDGFSIGFTDSLDEATSPPHVHVQVVPRRKGDLPTLPAGVEWFTDDHLLAGRR